MGLDTSHGCWRGGYGGFNVFRETLARAAGWPLGQNRYGEPSAQDGPRINWDAITDDNIMGRWETLPEDPLIVLVAHSDCDGELPVEALVPLADRLEGLLPKIHEATVEYAPAWSEGFTRPADANGLNALGPVPREHSIVGRTETFIAGLRTAAIAGEPVEFY